MARADQGRGSVAVGGEEEFWNAPQNLARESAGPRRGVVMRYLGFIVIISILLLWVGTTLAAKTPAGKGLTTAECLACHNDSSLSKDVNGKSVSLYVNDVKFKASIHGSMFQCTDCHQDVKAFPHEPAPAKVSCATCHAKEQSRYDSTLHAKAIKPGGIKAATCVDCHGSPHELLATSDPNSKVSHGNVSKTCRDCHGQI